jgi:hypothetical protein
MARCGCAKACNCLILGDNCIEVIGQGLSGTPITVSLIVDPAGGLVCGPDGLAVEAVTPPEMVASFSLPGTLEVATGKGRFRFPWAVELLGVSAAIDTPATGQAVIFDVNLNGTTIFTTQANRTSIAATGTDGPETTPDVTTAAAGSHLKVDVDQVGSGTHGADASVFVRYRRAA